MNNKYNKNKGSTANRNKGLLISVAAIIVLIILTTYKTPIFENELNGNILGFTEVHNKTELKIIATVRLDNGARVIATMSPELQKRYDTKAMLIEGVTMFGRKTYKVLSYNE